MGENLFYRQLLSKVCYFLCLLFLPFLSFAQSSTIHFHGIIKNQDNEGVPYASVLLQGTSRATTANQDGVFHLEVNERVFSESSKKLLVRSIGYKQAQVDLDTEDKSTWAHIQVNLVEEVFTLEAVVVGPKEDPANAMIRLAIRNRAKHLLEVPPYQADVYIKGVQRMVELPKKLLGLDMEKVASEIALDSNRTGIFYLSESVSKITVSPPKYFREEMIRSKMSGNNRSFSFNRASDLQLNFYENSSSIVDGLSARPFVSPISDHAFQYYRYQYQGFTEESGKRILKIKVIPKRKGEPVYRGDLYLVAGEGRIHSLNLIVDRSSSIQLVDSLQIRQQFLEHSTNVWFPSGAELDFGLSFLGVRVSGNFVASFTNYSTVKDEEVRSIPFRERLKIQASALKIDSGYWRDVRPIPLTMEEEEDYIRKDSIRQVRQSPAYLDSLDRAHNRFKLGSFFLNGYQYNKRSAKMSLATDGIFNHVNFNLIEGVNFKYGLRYRREVDSNLKRSLLVGASLRYGFLNRGLHPSFRFEYPTAFRGRFILEFGSEVRDLQSRHPHADWLGSYFILFQGENPFRLYQQKFARTNWSGIIPGNVHFKGGLWLEHRSWLENRTDYSFLPRKYRKFLPNNPFESNEGVALFTDHRSAGLETEISYDFGRDYETFPSGRKYLSSPYPTINLGFKKAFAIHDSYRNAAFSLIRFGVQQNQVSLGRFGHFSYAGQAGKFLEKPDFYLDFQHFEGMSFLFGQMGIETFTVLDRYRLSAREYFVEGHLQYNLGGILLGKIPGIRNLKMDEMVGIHYLHTEGLPHFAEWQVGLSWLGFQIRYGRYLPLSDQKLSYAENGISKHKIRIGIRF